MSKEHYKDSVVHIAFPVLAHPPKSKDEQPVRIQYGPGRRRQRVNGIHRSAKHGRNRRLQQAQGFALRRVTFGYADPTKLRRVRPKEAVGD